MKRILLLALPVLAFTAMALRPANDPLPIGAALPNPELKMMDISGKEVSFRESMKANGLLVMFSCNTCPVVEKYQTRTLEAAKFAAEKNIGVILLNSNEATRGNGESFEDMKEYASGQQYNFSYVVDKNSVMADAFGATRTPEVFLFDKNSRLVYHGAIDDNPNAASQGQNGYLTRSINELTSGVDISTQKTRSVGCTIKRL